MRRIQNSKSYSSAMFSFGVVGVQSRLSPDARVDHLPLTGERFTRELVEISKPGFHWRVAECWRNLT